MKKAIGETNRRRKIQTEFNYKNKIIPQTVKKGVRDVLEATVAAEVKAEYRVDSSKMPKKELRELIGRLEKEMRSASKELAFERAAEIRDLIIELKAQL